MKKIAHWVQPDLRILFRRINLFRFGCGILFLTLSLTLESQLYFAAASVYTLFAIFWFVQIEIALINENAHPCVSLIPNFVDSLFVSILVFFTGYTHSLFILGYALVSTLGAAGHERNSGVVSLVSSPLVFFFLGVFVKLGFISAGLKGSYLFPLIGKSDIYWAEIVISTAVLFSVLLILNRIVYGMSVKMRKGEPVRSAAEKKPVDAWNKRITHKK